jgi:hypothetical protein
MDNDVLMTMVGRDSESDRFMKGINAASSSNVVLIHFQYFLQYRVACRSRFTGRVTGRALNIDHKNKLLHTSNPMSGELALPKCRF